MNTAPRLLAVVCCAFVSMAAFAAEVPMETAESAAAFYGEQRWPGCQLLDVTPYYAFDGSVNAYAFQFIKEGSELGSPDEVISAVAKGEAATEALREAPPESAKESPEENRSVLLPAPTEEKVEESDDGKLRVEVTLPAGALDELQLRRRERLEAAAAESDWKEQTRAAANAAVLPDDVGTVIIAARRDLYPLLERFDGVAPHIKFASKARVLAGLQGMQPSGKTYYLGPMHILLQPDDARGPGGGALLVEPLKEQLHELSQAKAAAGSGVLPPAPSGKNGVPPEQFWTSFESSGAPPGFVDGGAVGSSNSIPDVPYYHQDDYGPASCGPTASAQALGYWDGHGYGNLIDNGSATSGHEDELIYDLMRAQGYNPTTGTDAGDVEPGVEAVCNTDAYGNNLNFDVVSDYAVAWTDITSEINARRPFVYGNWDTSKYPYWAHATTGTGYNDDSGHLLYVHYNYLPDTPYELNWDNIPSDNEMVAKISPNATPTFDCLWSEDFEGAFPGPWNVGGGWDDEAYRAHNYTPDPSPPGGATAWAAYCADTLVSPPGPYQNNMNTWMFFGPFSTIGRTSGEISAFVWRKILDTEGDWVALMTSTNGINFAGAAYTGDHANWQRLSLDFSAQMGLDQLWVAVWFKSDASSVSEGAYVDDVVIKLGGGSFTHTLSNDFPETFTEVPRDFSFQTLDHDWFAVGINPSTDHDIWADDDSAFGSPYATSTYGSTIRDFVAGNGHVFGSTTHYAKVTYGTTSTYVIEAEWNVPDLTVGVGYDDDMDSGEVIQVYEVLLNAGQVYRVDIDITSGTADLAGFLFGPGRSNGSRLDYDLLVNAHGAGGDESAYWPGGDGGYYGFVVVNDNAASAWYTVTFTPIYIPGAPTGVTASDGTYMDKVAVSWSSVSGATEYAAFRNGSQLSGWISGTSYNDTSAVPGTVYSYQVKARNPAGTSGLSTANTGYRGMAPAANFSATPTSGPAPLGVAFTDTTTGFPSSWLWDFGDGRTSGEPTPYVVYQNPGTYTVSLTVLNTWGNDTETKTGYVTVTGSPTTIFVDKASTASPETGMTWASAFNTLQEGVSAAGTSGAWQVWVKAGVYDEQRTSMLAGVNSGSLVLLEGIGVYGGFDGTENWASDRYLDRYATVIDGSTSRGGSPAYHVVFGANAAVLDNFTITGGNANAVPGAVDIHTIGGGLLAWGASMEVIECHFEWNEAEYGGGVAVVSATGSLYDCWFLSNTATTGAGALFLFNASPSLYFAQAGYNAGTYSGAVDIWGGSPYFYGCQFAYNEGFYGGAIFAWNCSPWFERTAFWSNVASLGAGSVFSYESNTTFDACYLLNESGFYGGALSNWSGSVSLSNTLIVQCQAYLGGGMFNTGTSVTALNCTVADDIATAAGGGAFNSNSTLNITNSVFYFNGPTGLYHDGTGGVTASYSDIEGGMSGTGNINADPWFDSSYWLLQGSPCIDTANTALAPLLDMYGTTRPLGPGADMGAIECW